MENENKTSALTPPRPLTPLANLSTILNRGKGREKGSMSRCSVCGKEDSRSDKRVDAKCPIHKRVHEEKLVERAAKLDKILLGGVIGLDERKDFNAQAEWIAQQILAARQEHEMYVPDEKEEGAHTPKLPALKYEDSAVGAILRECLDMLGAKANAESNPETLAEYVRGNLRLLLADIKK
jgi:hypothetical protein